MPTPDESVVDPKNISGVVDPTMPADGGVADDAMPAARSGDVKSIEAVQRKAEQDLRKLQSTLQRGHQQEIAALKKQLEELQQLATAKMDEKERAEFEKKRLIQENEELKQARILEQQQREQNEVVNSWIGFFQEKGVDPSVLDTSTPEALIQTGMTAISDLVDSLRNGKGDPKQPAAKRPAAPPVVTGSGRSPVTRRTIADAVQAVSTQTGQKLTESDLYDMHERGQIDLNNYVDFE